MNRTSLDTPVQESIAIVGMSGRFPGARSVGEFWENIKAGRSSITHFGENELEVDPADVPHDEATGVYVRAKGVLEDIEKFDARFFGYLPREAELMDPQHRIFLECAWEALESAGWDPDRYDGNIGVYAGCYMDTYLLANLCAHPEFLRRLVGSIQVGSLQTELGNDKDYLATRVSYKLNLRGPSVTVQTACSTSLVAIAHACQSLMTYQSDMALAGGVTITLPQRRGYFYKEGGMLSPDGECRAFSDRAQGTVFSNGAGVILLKRLSDALVEGDTIHAVIRGWALNNDGGQKLSYTAPSPEGQADVIATAHAMAGIDARTVGYVEAHGTATPLGDPIEIAGLTTAFRQTTTENGFCAVGSVKTNLGHLDVASGAIGTIKCALALRERVLPPSLHFERPNPNIDFPNTPFYINTRLRAWEIDVGPRRAGVSSFGVGGTNVHLVLEEPPLRDPTDGTAERIHVLPLSAKTPSALEAAASAMADHLSTTPEVDLSDVAFTLQEGRRRFEERRVVIARTRAAAIDALRATEGGIRGRARDDDGSVVFMFPGQGAQAPNMCKGLYATDAVFRLELDASLRVLEAHAGRDLGSILYPEEGAEQEAADRMRQTEVAQPLIFAVEYALARSWMSRGLEPAALVGHSIGELAAAVIADVMDLDAAAAVVVARGNAMQAMPPGGMISVRAPGEQVLASMPEALELAALNGPALCVVSGPDEAIEAWTPLLDAQGMAWSRLHTSHAFHSRSMEPAAAALKTSMRGMPLRAPGVPIHSTVTGALLRAAEATSPEYWGRQLRETVRFEQALRSAIGAGPRALLEVGPGQTLTTLGRQIVGRDSDVRCVPSLGPVQAPGDDAEHMAAALGSLWVAGVRLAWTKAAGAARRVPLPTYPFERKRYWVDPPASSTAAEPLVEAAPSGAVSGDDELETLIRGQLALMRQQLSTLSQL